MDGTQAVGAEPFDFAALQPDLLVCAGYKWLLGPYQIGFAAVGARLRDARPLEEHWSNRAGSEDVSNMSYLTEYRTGARRFDVGEHANHITVPMLSEGVRQVLEWQPARVQAYCAELGRHLEPVLHGEGFSAVAPEERAAHIIGLRVQRAELLPPIVARLGARNVRVSQRGTSLRISPNVYNRQADVEALVAVLEDATP